MPLELPQRLTEDNVFPLLERLCTSTEPVRLDLTGVVAQRAAAPLFTNALLTALPAHRFDVHADMGGAIALARNGILFGIANRASEGGDDALEKWRTPWSRSRRDPYIRLFSDSGEGADTIPSVFGPQHAAFINPHRSGPNPRHSGVAAVVRPWLRRLLPALAQQQDEAGIAFARDVSIVIDELIDNVAWHAAAPSGTPERGSLHSMVFVSVVRGNNENARYRVHIQVLDTGVGILASARPKLLPLFRSLGDCDALRQLFMGSLPPVGRGRGFGLPKVWKIVSGWSGGRLVAYANGVRLVGQAGEELVADSVSDLIGGTVLSVTFPIPAQRLTVAS